MDGDSLAFIPYTVLGILVYPHLIYMVTEFVHQSLVRVLFSTHENLLPRAGKWIFHCESKTLLVNLFTYYAPSYTT